MKACSFLCVTYYSEVVRRVAVNAVYYIVKSDDILDILVAGFHFRSFYIPKADTEVSYLVVHFNYVRLMGFCVFLK